MRLHRNIETDDSASRIIGNAASGLSGDTSWAVNDDVARIGADGERRTAELLNKMVADRRRGPTVLHDLMVPGYKANVDHAVVSGRTVLLIDTKVWQPGRYWTWRHITRRGWQQAPHIIKIDCAFPVDRISTYLDDCGLKATLPPPLVAVWPSSRRGKCKIGLLRIRGGKPVHAQQLVAEVRRFAGTKPADPQIVAALARLVNHDGTAQSYGDRHALTTQRPSQLDPRLQESLTKSDAAYRFPKESTGAAEAAARELSAGGAPPQPTSGPDDWWE